MLGVFEQGCGAAMATCTPQHEREREREKEREERVSGNLKRGRQSCLNVDTHTQYDRAANRQTQFPFQ